MPPALEPDHAPHSIRTEEHDPEEAQHVSLGDPEEAEDRPGEEDEDHEAE
jgi:hypothetical protein